MEKITNRLGHECGALDWMQKHLGGLVNLTRTLGFSVKILCFSILSKFLIHRFDPKEVSDEKKKFTNRLGHEFCVRPGFYRSFGDVLGELSRIHFAK